MSTPSSPAGANRPQGAGSPKQAQGARQRPKGVDTGAQGIIRAIDVGRSADADRTGRQRAAVDLIRSHERTLRRTARRYSLCTDDAEDAFQRALEILLTKAPTDDPGELIRWMQTVTKHEALAVRRNRERILGSPDAGGRDGGATPDWIQLIPSEGAGPADQAERRERIARTREALQSLKPQELKALTLLAEGYSYSEIGELTGWTYTKVNRCLAEGRQRFRDFLSRIDEGRRCEELGMALSAFCDGEAGPAEVDQLREHLRTCSHCRAKLRAFRAAPRAAAALAPAIPISRTLPERIHDLAATVQSRIPGRGGVAETAVSQIAATGGPRGAGTALMAKVLAACVGTAGGAAACVAAGVVPQVGVGGDGRERPAIERQARDVSKQLTEQTQKVATYTPPVAPATSPQPGAGTGTADPSPAPATPPPPAPAPVQEFSPEAASGPVSSGGGSSSGGSGARSRASSGGTGGELGP